MKKYKITLIEELTYEIEASSESEALDDYMGYANALIEIKKKTIIEEVS